MRSTLFAALAGLVFLTGCLPSCGRQEERALMPEDSLSRAHAATVQVDTLRAAWTSPSGLFAYPRTVRWTNDGHLAVSDPEADRVVLLDSTGTVAREWSVPGTPFLAGLLADTVVVFEANNARFHFLTPSGLSADSVVVPNLPEDRTLVRYGAATSNYLYFKAGSAETRPFVQVLSREGTLLKTYTFEEGRHWRYAGLLRTQGDTLLSLSGYRPVIDRLTLTDQGLSRDTLSLFGFDSPMLFRTRLAMKRKSVQAPLITSASAVVGTYVFALNLRPGWIQVDVFENGTLVRSLIAGDVAINRNFWPVDLDVRAVEGGFDLAVALTRPEAQILRFHWSP